MPAIPTTKSQAAKKVHPKVSMADVEPILAKEMEAVRKKVLKNLPQKKGEIKRTVLSAMAEVSSKK